MIPPSLEEKVRRPHLSRVINPDAIIYSPALSNR